MVSAAVVIGAGGIGAGTGPLFNPLIGSIQPVKAVEITNRNCDLTALSRVEDDRFCDKYFVCSNGKYVGLFCPLGMAFDYGLQECRLKQQVDCTRRPLFGKYPFTFSLCLFGRIRLVTSLRTPTICPNKAPLWCATESVSSQQRRCKLCKAASRAHVCSLPWTDTID